MPRIPPFPAEREVEKGPFYLKTTPPPPTKILASVNGVILVGGKASPIYGSHCKHVAITQSCIKVGLARIRLTGIEPAMGCDAGPALNRYCVGRPTLCVQSTWYWFVNCLISECHSTFRSEKDVSLASRPIALILASTGDGGGRNRHTRYARYTFLLGSFNYPGHLWFWPMRKTNTVMFPGTQLLVLY